MPPYDAIGRRELLKLFAAIGAAGAVGETAMAAGTQQLVLPAGTLLIGTGGTGCKVVRRAIQMGFDTRGFAAIDADCADLAASGAAHQIHCGAMLPDGTRPIDSHETAETRTRIDALLQGVSRLVVVTGLGGRTGAYWMFEIAGEGRLAARHIRERGMTAEAVTTLPRGDEFINQRFMAVGRLGALRQHRALKVHVNFEDDWRL